MAIGRQFGARGAPVKGALFQGHANAAKIQAEKAKPLTRRPDFSIADFKAL
jgi:hypothetical protein